MIDTRPVEAELLISSGCAHCAGVTDALARLVKEGRLARLEVINLDRVPELAAERGVRALPWTRIGPFELTGGHSYRELAQWAEQAAAGEGWADYLLLLLESRRLPEVLRMITAEPQRLAALLDQMGQEHLGMGARIAISAVVEELAGSETLRARLPQLMQLTLSDQPQTRADACHFLGLCGDRGALPTVRRLLDDEDAEVREIAFETLAVLDHGDGGAEAR